MGPFHLVGHEFGLPAWVIQRSWMSLVLITAFLGVLRLAARLELGTANTRLLGGLAFALSPRILTEIGGNSAEIWPVAVLPWVLLPLIGPRAQERPRTAAMRSGVAIVCMGAVNATTVLALLPLPALWLLPGLRRAAGRRLAAWWVLSGVLGCTWWFLPLLLQGRYSPDFLNYIETAATTTNLTSPAEVLRGTSQWLGYLSTGGQPWWRAGWTLVTNGGVILDTGILAALCAVGLLRRRMPGQGRLVAAAAVGLLAMSAAHVGPLHGPLTTPLRQLLDGSGAAFRNVHKFDGLVRLPLALGLCHLLSLPVDRKLRRLLTGFVAVALMGAASPALAGQLSPAGGYEALPTWWRSTGSWLDAHDARGRALVVPAAGFGEYLWGRTLDNPLQALTTTPWAVRDSVPLGTAGTTRLLDAIDVRLDTGHGSAALSEVLARAGVRYLVVSNDLDPTRTGAPRAVLIHQALNDSPGITRVASFGPTIGGDSPRPILADDGLNLGYQAVEVYAVNGSTAPVEALPTATSWVLSGGPESLFQLADRGLLTAHATILAGDGTAGPSPRSAVTDALRRREVAFGSVRDNFSQTLTATAPLTREQAVPDILPVPGAQHLATVRLVGATSVSASSSASDAGTLFDHGPQNRPASAFDGDPDTAWVTGSSAGATGQWLQIDLAVPVDPTGTTVRLLEDAAVQGIPSTVTVHTDAGTATTSLLPGQQAQLLNVPRGSTRRLRLTLTTVPGDGFGTLVGIRELAVPGVHVAESVVLPFDQQQSSHPVVLLDRAAGEEGSCVQTGHRSVCSPLLGRPGEDVARLDRTFTLQAPVTFPISGSVLPEAGPALDALLDSGSAVTVSASSRLVSDPSERPSTVLDGDPLSGWIAGRSDGTPALTLSWRAPRRLDEVTLRTDPTLAAARPTQVEITTDRATTSVSVPSDGVVRFPAATTTSLRLRFTQVEVRTDFSRDSVIRVLPVGISDLTVPGLRDLVGSPAADDAAVTAACGLGPAVQVDGTSFRTAVVGSRGDLVQRRPMQLQICDLPTGLALGAGEHRIVAANRNGFAVQGLTFGSTVAGSTADVRTTTVLTWNAEHRVVEVAPGGASYLVVHENFNRGWRAALNGRTLATARVDGWQQAWVVPQGSGGRVTLTFGPGRTFHLGLLLGALLVLVLLALAVVPERRRGVEPGRDLDLPSAVRVLLGLGVLVLLGGPVGAALYLALLAGLLVRRLVKGRQQQPVTTDSLTLLYAAAMAMASLLTALSPWAGRRPPAAFGQPVQLLALVALAAAAAVLSGAVTGRTSPSDASDLAPAAPPVEGSPPPPAG